MFVMFGVLAREACHSNRILNVSPRTVQAWETNARRSSDAALKLLSVAETNPEVLLG
jgi:DNA-binding transcriptional regulator YiaG